MIKKIFIYNLLVISILSTSFLINVKKAEAQTDMNKEPVLVITNKTKPYVSQPVYNTPSRSSEIISRAPEDNGGNDSDYLNLYKNANNSKTEETPPQQIENNLSQGVRPLAKIRFNKPNVNYEQPIYNAVQNALKRFPNSRIELMAIHPSTGNPAQVAIESTRSRRNAEEVLRKLTQMGVPLERIDMSAAGSPEAQSSEVLLFVR